MYPTTEMRLCSSLLKYPLLMSFVGILLLIGCNQNTSNQPKTEIANYSYDVEEKLKEMGITLTEPIIPKTAKIEPFVKVGNLLFLSGKGPRTSDGTLMTGKVGSDLTAEEGAAAARQVAINQLEVIKMAVGDLNKVKQVVKVLGMVNATDDFKAHPQVINGFSELMIEVFGDRGRHARSAVGMASLPSNITCEIEIILEVED